jgi:hypothetical protein
MKKLTICSLMMLAVPTVWAEDLYLEGITTLGVKKSAYLSVKGGKITVREGESIGSWQVLRIERNRVVLSSGQGVTTELALHTRFDNSLPSAITESALEPPAEMKDEEEARLLEEIAAISENTQPLNSSVASNHATTATVDNTIPAGYRKIHTPFGDVLVEEKSLTAESSVVSAEPVKIEQPSLPKIADEAVPAGQRRVRTPFGDVLIKEKSPTPNPPSE